MKENFACVGLLYNELRKTPGFLAGFLHFLHENAKIRFGFVLVKPGLKCNSFSLQVLFLPGYWNFVARSFPERTTKDTILIANLQIFVYLSFDLQNA